MRERAARWGLWPGVAPCPEPGLGTGDEAPEHEPAAHPEVCVQTGVESAGSAVADVLRASARHLGPPLGDRLRGTAGAGAPAHAEQAE